MQNKADVGFVNSHPEGDRGHNDPRSPAHELFLRPGAVFNSGVIVNSSDSLAAQQAGQLLTARPGSGIHDTRARLVGADIQE